MSRSLALGNGSILINLDQTGQVRDLYFPYVGLENQVGDNLIHRVGIWINGKMSWLSDADWQIKINCNPETFIGKIEAENKRLQVEIVFNDIVYNEKDIFLRRLEVKNRAGYNRTIKIYFGQQFEPYKSRVAHTAYYDPKHKAIIHYRNQRAFIINATIEGRNFNSFSTGVFNAEGKQGTHIDAEDGQLSSNPIEHGQADSVIGLEAEFEPEEEKFVYYWLAVGRSIKEILDLNDYVLYKGAAYLIKTSQDFWHAWVNRQNFNFYGLNDSLIELFKKSLFYVRSHVDVDGGIIASGDSNMLQQGKDTYAYVWPRDAAYASLALDRSGDYMVTKRFFEFSNEVISEEGYFMHKYSPDRSLGSSWHGWLRDGQPELPIQEDETATVITALWQHYELSKDLEFIELIYNSLIKKAADFMVIYRDQDTGLPKASYDLWEEKFGIHTYTACSVYGGLIAAARFAKLLGKIKSERRYLEAATEIRDGILDHLYDSESGIFFKSILIKNDEKQIDKTIDISSFFGLFYFDVLSADDEKVKKFYEQIKNKLICPTPVGGVIRYEGDGYYRRLPELSGNPWVVTSLWLAQYLIAIAKSENDLEEVKNWLGWAVKNAQASGILSEQLDPITGAQLSATPLVWSHAEYITTVVKYLDKLEEFGVCPACNPVY